MKDFKDVLAMDTIIQRSDEWFALRKNMLTASDVASAIGVNPYSSRRQLLINKVHPSNVRFDTEATRHGTFYEGVAIEKFAALTGNVIHDIGIFVHPMYSWLGGSPDGITEQSVLIEVKCPLKRKIEHKIPDYYYPQVQTCMEILDIDMCHFIQFKPATDTCEEILDILDIPRDRPWFKNNLNIMHEFWKDVELYRADLTFPTSLYGIDPKKTIDLSDIHISNYDFIEDT